MDRLSRLVDDIGDLGRLPAGMLRGVLVVYGDLASRTDAFNGPAAGWDRSTTTCPAY